MATLKLSSSASAPSLRSTGEEGLTRLPALMRPLSSLRKTQPSFSSAMLGRVGSRPGSRSGVVGVKEYDWLENPEPGDAHAWMVENSICGSVRTVGQDSPSANSGSAKRMVSPGGTQALLSHLNHASDTGSLDVAHADEGKSDLRTLDFLGGVSQPTEHENIRGALSLSVFQRRGAGDTIQSTSEQQQQLQQESISEMEDFGHATSRLFSSMDELRNRHQAFEGPLLGRNATLREAKQSSGKDEGSEEVEERRAARLRAYKMVRKLDETNLPPLVRSPHPAEFIRREDSHVNFNVSLAALHSYSAEAVKENLGSRLMLRQRHRELVAQRYEKQKILEDMRGELSWTTKMKQAERAKARRGLTEFPADKWLTFYAILAFARAVAPGDRKMDGSAGARPLPEEALTLDLTTVDKKSLISLNLLTAIFKCRFRVKRSHNSARIIARCLSTWSTCGRLMVTMQTLARRVRLLQAWWRSCSKRLHESREKISKRWVALERAELMREMSRSHNTPSEAPPQSNNRFGKRTSAHRLSLEEKVEMERVEDAVRLRFIENELRGRRFALLPAIERWEEEVRQWHESLTDIKITSEALGTIRGRGLDADDADFGWRPPRPSHVPPCHPATEEQTGVCVEGCLGRKGDQQILEMWRTCRKNPEDWKSIPTARTPVPTAVRGPVPRKANASGSSATGGHEAAGQRKSKQEVQRMFGNASDEDLKRWDLDPEKMPGSQAPKGVRFGDSSGVMDTAGLAPVL
eukprot:TRINITY_DN40117_c0_g1_i1.p1 TRINITY_DN40117_c0_g1~~TRINITY_DN40117_c0_g1_i1.p1  ORF type:complete len:748 (+),score=116.93 TRINITY_DN40117_c0_g1_i1:268-2511(+)